MTLSLNPSDDGSETGNQGTASGVPESLTRNSLKLFKVLRVVVL